MASAVSGFSRHHFEEFLRNMLRQGIPSQTLQCLDARDALAAQNKINKIKSHARKEAARAQEGMLNPNLGTPFDNISLSVDGSKLIVMNIESTGMKLADFVVDSAPPTMPTVQAATDDPPHWEFFQLPEGIEAFWNDIAATNREGAQVQFPNMDAARDWCRASDRTGIAELPVNLPSPGAPTPAPIKPEAEDLF